MAQLIVGDPDCSIQSVLEILRNYDEGVKVPRWVDFAMELDIKRAWIEEIESSLHNGHKSIRFAYRATLQKWIICQRGNATLERIINILNNLERTETVVKIQEKFFPTYSTSKVGASSQTQELEVVDKMLKGRRIHGGKGNRRARLVALDGFDVSSKTELFEGVQNYYEIKQECLSKNILFDDPEFPAINPSLFVSDKKISNIQWLRPHEIVKNPHFLVDGVSQFDVKQGQLGDNWLLAAVANLTLMDKTLFEVVVPNDNSFVTDYCGIFHFRFWQYGNWVDVVVDDKLPTIDGQLCFMHSDESNEFWSALFEKAYAKLHGSYEALEKGYVCEALAEFTGGVMEIYELKEDKQWFTLMEKAFAWIGYMGCSLNSPKNSKFQNYVYSITKLKRVQTANGRVNLVRLQSPRGKETKLPTDCINGKKWYKITQKTQAELGLTCNTDDEFWMNCEDFINVFDSLEICNLNTSDGKGWNINKFEGSWAKNSTAGGCLNHLAFFANNPQFIIELTQSDIDDEEGKCTVLISLSQTNRRPIRTFGMDCLLIGFTIHFVPKQFHGMQPLPRRFFKQNAPAARSGDFKAMREVCRRFSLEPGTYVITPCTFYPNEEGSFLLRVCTKTSANMRENDDEIGIGNIDESLHLELDENDLENFLETFNGLAGEDGDVDWIELRELLNDKCGIGKQFADDTCRSLIALMDGDMSGKLNFNEFLELIKTLILWQKVFEKFDVDDSENLNSFELRNALGAAGYRVNQKVLRALVLRFGDEKGNVSFDNFICCATKLKAMLEIFQQRATVKHTQMRTSFTLEEWITTTLYS